MAPETWHVIKHWKFISAFKLYNSHKKSSVKSQTVLCAYNVAIKYMSSKLK